MIEEMREDVGEHHEAGGKPNLPHANAAQQHREPEAAIYTRCAYVNVGGCLCRHGGPSFECQSERLQQSYENQPRQSFYGKAPQRE
jgi:hypothetical protein